MALIRGAGSYKVAPFFTHNGCKPEPLLETLCQEELHFVQVLVRLVNVFSGRVESLSLLGCEQIKANGIIGVDCQVKSGLPGERKCRTTGWSI